MVGCQSILNFVGVEVSRTVPLCLQCRTHRSLLAVVLVWMLVTRSVVGLALLLVLVLVVGSQNGLKGAGKLFGCGPVLIWNAVLALVCRWWWSRRLLGALVVLMVLL